MAQTLININGDIRDASSITAPDRKFRDAWQFNGDVIEINLVKAKEIRAGQLVAEAKEAAEEADKQVWKAELKGDGESVSDARILSNRRKATPSWTAVINAASPEALAKVTIDDVT